MGKRSKSIFRSFGTECQVAFQKSYNNLHSPPVMYIDNTTVTIKLPVILYISIGKLFLYFDLITSDVEHFTICELRIVYSCPLLINLLESFFLLTL